MITTDPRLRGITPAYGRSETPSSGISREVPFLRELDVKECPTRTASNKYLGKYYVVWIKATEILQLRPSQDSVDYATLKGRAITLDELAEAILEKQWDPDQPIAAVKMPDGIWTSLDNRRLTAAYLAIAMRLASKKEVQDFYKTGNPEELKTILYRQILKKDSNGDLLRFTEIYANDIAITSLDIPHFWYAEPEVVNLYSIRKIFGENRPEIKTPLKKGTYGEAIYLRMHAGEKHEMLAKLEKRAEANNTCPPYGFISAPFIRR